MDTLPKDMIWLIYRKVHCMILNDIHCEMFPSNFRGFVLNHTKESAERFNKDTICIYYKYNFSGLQPTRMYITRWTLPFFDGKITATDFAPYYFKIKSENTKYYIFK